MTVKYDLFDWLSGISREEKQAEQDEVERRWAESKASFSKTKNVQRAERTFLPDLTSDADRRKIAHQNREKLLALQYQMGKTNPELMNAYVHQRYLTPNPSNDNRIVIEEAKELYMAEYDLEQFKAAGMQKYGTYETSLRNKTMRLAEAKEAFYAILPELLAADARYYGHKVTQKTANKQRENVKYRTIIDGIEHLSQEPAPKVGDQTAFFRNAAKSSKTATTEQSLADADAFWAMSAKLPPEKPKYEPDLIDKLFKPFKFFK